MSKTETVYVQRFNVFARLLHLTVIISFLTLALTGMALKFADEPWAGTIAAVFGSFRVLGVLHRIGAVLTFGYFFLHFILIFQNWRKTDRSLVSFILDKTIGMVPNIQDVKEIGQTLKWFVGAGDRPRYGRWTYWEKFDYFAVFWGVAVIGLTGICLWFPEWVTQFFPGSWLNIATIIHSDEALLATGFIFTIHFFNTHIRPEKWPLDRVIFTGTITLDELKHERPREYEMLVEEGRLDDVIVDRPPLWLIIFSYVFGFSALTIGMILVFTIIYTIFKMTFL
ncbi:hypothetical protein DGMP_05380 [Desulfomarina profundi]|uniref:Cytochrome b561 bacterial/Ni-hydrogenase domain-containing protein n=1 Tax=Desulfomarina profundi TaxID=2772557 RepID=A0A8D5FFY9_9BACT|nr:hypothetical protein [Desulfomarina profundi]BCL59845.1 hypothetical protein DGMP_05380 [Desulfomarina profundi]